MDNEISILIGGRVVFMAIACIASPEKGITQQGLIRMMGGGGGQQGKHVVYMLAQRSLLDFEEKILKVEHVDTNTLLEVDPGSGSKVFKLENGAILAMDSENRIRFWAHEGLDPRSVLVVFHRMATRMIRLDVP